PDLESEAVAVGAVASQTAIVPEDASTCAPAGHGGERLSAHRPRFKFVAGVREQLLIETHSDFCLNSPTGAIMKIYSLAGYSINVFYLLGCAYFAPAYWG